MCQLLKPKRDIHQLPETCLNHLQTYLFLQFKHKPDTACMGVFVRIHPWGTGKCFFGRFPVNKHLQLIPILQSQAGEGFSL